MIKKLCIYIKSGGFYEAANYAMVYFKKIFYYVSETDFYFLDRNNFIPRDNSKDIEFKKINCLDELEKIKFPRLKTINYKKWLMKGDVAIIGYLFSKPVCFNWNHFKQHNIPGIGKIKLSEDKCWTGPTFVLKTVRGCGINNEQVNYQIKTAPAGVKYFLTSINSKNTASIKSVKKIGYKKGLKIISYHGFLTTKKTEIEFEKNCEPVFQLEI